MPVSAALSRKIDAKDDVVSMRSIVTKVRNVNCIEFYGMVSEKVDNRLSSEQIQEFNDHARKCHPCDVEYLIAATTKAVLREKVHCIPVPSDVYLAILQSTIGTPSSPTPEMRHFY